MIVDSFCFTEHFPYDNFELFIFFCIVFALVETVHKWIVSWYSLLGIVSFHVLI